MTFPSRSWMMRSVCAASLPITFGIAPVAFAQAGPVDAVAAKPQAPEEARSMEEIIVTASRRSATLRETPIAISAYGGEELARKNIVAFTDLVVESPNVQLGSNDSITNIVIRGVGSNLTTAGNDPGVAFHVNGIYLPDTALSRLSFMDVQRVEVLRGPQGTLFGRNATGGAINVISNTPQPTPSVEARVTTGFPLGEQVQVVGNSPLNSDGTILARLSMQQTYQRGRLKNRSPIGPRRFDDKNDYAVRAQLEFRPSATVRLRVQGDYQLSDTVGPAPYLAGNVSGTLPTLLATADFASPYDDDNEVALTSGDTKFEVKAISVFGEVDIAGGTLSATLSRRHSDVYTFRDGDGTTFEFNSAIVDQPRNNSFAEVMYSSDDSKDLSAIVGANYFRDTYTQNLQIPIYFSPVPLIIDAAIRSTSYSMFGHAQYKVTPQWKLFGGLRYSSDRKSIDDSNNFVGAASFTDKWSKVTFELGTSYELTDRANAYLKYATGYKSGGFSAGSIAPSFLPESNRMWELGLKGTFIGGALDANIALFHMSYSDLQINQLDGNIAAVTNAAKATNYGAEVELALHVTPDLRLLLSGGWLHARFDKFDTIDSARPSAGLLHLKGNVLPQAPNFTLGGGPAYNHEFADGSQIWFSARYDWKSRVYFSEFNLPLSSQKSAGVLSASVNYALPNGQWEFGLYGRNLTDERIFSNKLVYSALLDSIAVGNLQPRREFGAQVRFHY